jgi:hypothetical protein
VLIASIGPEPLLIEELPSLSATTISELQRSPVSLPPPTTYAVDEADILERLYEPR